MPVINFLNIIHNNYLHTSKQVPGNPCRALSLEVSRATVILLTFLGIGIPCYQDVSEWFQYGYHSCISTRLSPLLGMVWNYFAKNSLSKMLIADVVEGSSELMYTFDVWLGSYLGYDPKGQNGRNSETSPSRYFFTPLQCARGNRQHCHRLQTERVCNIHWRSCLRNRTSIRHYLMKPRDTMEQGKSLPLFIREAPSLLQFVQLRVNPETLSLSTVLVDKVSALDRISHKKRKISNDDNSSSYDEDLIDLDVGKIHIS